MVTIDEFRGQDIFNAKMLREYRDYDVLSDGVYAPYFEWKAGNRNTITREEAMEISHKASDDLWNLYQKYPDAPAKATSMPIWGPYEGYGADKYLASYLETIDAEICNFMIG